MDGLGRPAGAGLTIEFNGETLILSPLTLKDFGLIEQHLLSKRTNPLEMVKQHLADMPIEVATALAKEAYNDARKMNVVPADEVGEWIDSFEGLVYCFWLMIRKEHGDKYSLEQITEVMDAMSEQDLIRMKEMRDKASGTDELGNSTGGTRSSMSQTRETHPAPGGDGSAKSSMLPVSDQTPSAI